MLRFRGWVFAGSAFVGLVAAASGVQAQDWPGGMFDTASHDFGSIPRGAKAEYSFVITNRWSADLHIASVRASCGCTTPRIEKPLLKTYEQGAIIAHLNSDAYLGHRSATLTVTIDQPAYAEVQLQVKAFVHEDVLMEPSSVEFGAVDQGSGGEARVKLYRANMPDWQITEVRSINPLLSGQIVQLARQGSQVWYELRVRLAPTAPTGYLRDHVVLMTNDSFSPQIPVLVEGQVQSEIAVSPASLFLGVLRPGDKVTKPVVVRAKKPFRIKSVTGDKASFTFAAADDEAKTLHLVPVTFMAGADFGKVVKTIQIRTDLSDTPAEVSTYAVVNADGN